MDSRYGSNFMLETAKITPGGYKNYARRVRAKRDQVKENRVILKKVIQIHEALWLNLLNANNQVRVITYVQEYFYKTLKSVVFSNERRLEVQPERSIVSLLPAIGPCTEVEFLGRYVFDFVVVECGGQL